MAAEFWVHEKRLHEKDAFNFYTVASVTGKKELKFTVAYGTGRN